MFHGNILYKFSNVLGLVCDIDNMNMDTWIVLSYEKVDQHFLLCFRIFQTNFVKIFSRSFLQSSSKFKNTTHVNLSVQPCIAVQWIISLEAKITKLTFYRIRCFVLSKDAFTANLMNSGQCSELSASNKFSFRIEILQVLKKLQNRQKLKTFWIVLNLGIDLIYSCPS